MSNYTKATNFATKDSLPSGNPAKIVKGTEINDEYDAIEVAVNSKADINSPTFTGDPKAPTPAAADNDTSLATTAFVKTVISTGKYVKNGGLDDDIVDARALNVSGNGTAGYNLTSDGDGSFSWDAPVVQRIQAPATSNPTTRDDGSSLQEGDLYYKTDEDIVYSYDGANWNPITGNFPLPLGTIDTSNTIGEATIASIPNSNNTLKSQDFTYYGQDVTGATLEASISGTGNVTVQLYKNGTSILNTSAGGGNLVDTVSTDLDNGDTITFKWRDWDYGSTGTFSVLCANPYSAGCGFWID